jgi:hypothetical protein
VFNGTVLNEFDTRVLTESTTADAEVHFLRRSNLTVNPGGQLLAPYDVTVDTVNTGIVYGGVPNRVYATGENNLGLPKLTTSNQVTLRSTPTQVYYYGSYTLVLYGSGLGFDILVNTTVELSVTSGNATDGDMSESTAMVVVDGLLRIYRLVFGMWTLIQTMDSVVTVSTHGTWLVVDSKLYKFSYQWYDVFDYTGTPSKSMIHNGLVLLYDGDVRVFDLVGTLLFQTTGVSTYDLFDELLVIDSKVYRYEFGTFIYKYNIGSGVPSIAGNEHVWVGGDLYYGGNLIKSISVDGTYRGARVWSGVTLGL